MSLPFSVLGGLKADNSAMVVGNGLSSNFYPIELVDDIERIGFMLENPPVEFGAKMFVWDIKNDQSLTTKYLENI